MLGSSWIVVIVVIVENETVILKGASDIDTVTAGGFKTNVVISGFQVMTQGLPQNEAGSRDVVMGLDTIWRR